MDSFLLGDGCGVGVCYGLGWGRVVVVFCGGHSGWWGGGEWGSGAVGVYCDGGCDAEER